MIDKFSKDREDSEQRIFHKLTVQVDQISLEIQKDYQQKTQAQAYFQNCLEEDLPLFSEEIRKDSLIREEIEQKIFQQFTEQIGELQDMFEIERKERESREEELIGILKVIYQKIQDGILKAKQDRTQNEEMLVRLVEQVIEKVKRELIESDSGLEVQTQQSNSNQKQRSYYN